MSLFLLLYLQINAMLLGEICFFFYCLVSNQKRNRVNIGHLQAVWLILGQVPKLVEEVQKMFLRHIGHIFLRPLKRLQHFLLPLSQSAYLSDIVPLQVNLRL